MPLTLDDAAAHLPLSTERLVLRRARAQDAPAVHRYRSLPEVARWLTTLDRDIEEFTQRFTRADHLGPTLVLEHEGRVIGDVLVRIEDAWAQAEVSDRAVGAQAEIGWVLDPALQGRGLATEAAGAVLDLCLVTLGLHRVTAICFAENTASWRLMERLGMRRETHAVADSLHRDGRWADSFTYARLASEHRRAATGPSAHA